MPDIFNASTYQKTPDEIPNQETAQVVTPPAAPIPVLAPVPAQASTPPSPLQEHPEIFVAAQTLLQQFHTTANPFTAFSPEPFATSFDSQTTDEQVLLLVRQHPIFIIQKLSFAVLLLLLPLLIPFLPFLALIPVSFIAVIVMAWYLGIFGFILQTFLNWYFNVYIISNERIVAVEFTSLFYKHISYAQIDKIEDVTATSSGFLGAVLDFGHLEVQTAGATDQFEFDNVPHPTQVAKFINELLNAVQKEERTPLQ